jgi:hypothetical protein
MTGGVREFIRTVVTVSTVLSPALGSAAATHTYVVCADDSRGEGCQFNGDGGIQTAIDQAASGDTILVKAGRYSPASYRDVPYKDFTVRGYVVVDGKNVSIVGETGTVLDGGNQRPATAIVVHNASMTLRDLEITGFRYDLKEDDIYDGHGVFVIDGKVRIDNLAIRRSQKMALTGRGDTQLDVSNLQVLDSHVGIWLHESAYLRLRNSVIRGNESSAIAAYDNSVAHIANSVFDGNLDDGLYSEQRAAIYATNSLIVRNKPVGAHAKGASRILLTYCVLYGNATGARANGKAEVSMGIGTTENDPRVGPDYRPLTNSPLVGAGDPDLGRPVGTRSDIGLYWIHSETR